MGYSPDYAKIAPVYDEARSRYVIHPDRDLKEARERAVHSGEDRIFTVLDVACGTGNYLQRQYGHFGTAAMRWYGIDRSPDMLARARGKDLPVDLRRADVEALPFDDGFVDFAVCNFAFHHFQDKKTALDEILRVLAGNGTVKIHNINPDKMEAWWVYRFFPETRDIDRERFMTVEMLWGELESRGCTVRTRGKYATTRVSLFDVRAQALCRDISQIALLPDDRFNRGIERIEAELASDPDASLFTENAIISVVGIRNSP